LWENPEFIFEVLLNSSIDDIKDNLSDFFINNFYENVLSQNCIENNLLYVIALSLKEEINSLIDKEKPEPFLNKTYCGYMLEKLSEKNDNIINDNIAIDELKQAKNENTFQRLINLQKLIKKESALKELSKKYNIVNKF
jgi:hypothetical protein